MMKIIVPVLLRVMQLALCCYMGLPAAPALAEWRVVETGHFRIYGDAAEAELIKYAQRLEGVHYLLTIATAMQQKPSVNKLRVYYVYGRADVRRAYSRRRSDSVAGFYRPSLKGAVAVVPQDAGTHSGSFNSQVVLFHEYAHHFMLQYQPAAYPPWYVEGFAELVSTASFERPGAITFGKAARHRAAELDQGTWIPLDELFARPTERAGKRNPVSFYGQSWLLAHYLTLSGKRPGQLRQYLLAINNGKSDQEAFQVFGDTLDDLEREARIYLRGRSFVYRAPALPPEVMNVDSVRVLRPGEAASVDDLLQSRLHLDQAERTALAASIATKAGRFPDEPALHLLLADQYYELGRWQEAEAAADRVLELDSRCARASALKGMAMLQQLGETAAHDDAGFLRAQNWVIRANNVDPDDPVPLASYFQTYAVAGRAAPEDALDSIVRASELVPQDEGLRLTAAYALIASGQHRRALLRLLPMANDAHQSSARTTAQALVQWIADGAEGAPPRRVAEKGETEKTGAAHSAMD